MKSKLFAALITTIFIAFISCISPTSVRAEYPWSSSEGYDVEDDFVKALESGPNLANWIGHIWMYSLQTADCAIGGCGRDAVGGGGSGGGSGGFGNLNNEPAQAGSNSALGMLGLGLKTIYEIDPPAHTPYYLAKLNPIKPAHASAGTEILNFVFELWKVARNIAYLLIVIVLVIAGILIMFRKRLDPYTEVTVVSALPKIIISLLLITFSYAIAALILDLGVYVGKGLVENVVNSIDSYTYQDINAIQIWTEFGVDKFIEILKESMKAANRETNIPFLGFPLIVGLIFNFALLSVMVTLLMKLIINYAKWFALTVGAPIIFLIGSLPGSGEQIKNWFLNFFAATLAFPATYLVLNIAMYIKMIGTPGVEPEFTDPNIAFFDIPGVTTALMSDLVFFGLILMAKNIPDMIQNLLIERPSEIDTREITGALQKLPIVGGLVG